MYAFYDTSPAVNIDNMEILMSYMAEYIYKLKMIGSAQQERL